jgi:peptide/nickel transport system substrate-binding protein
MRRAAALLLAACAAVVPGTSGAQGSRHPYTIPHVLRYATAEDIVGLNPHLVTQTTLSYLSSNTMAWLLRYDKHNRPVPELATAVPSRANGGISADGKTITYHLRHDAKWSDGVPFTAADVRFSVDVVRNPKNNELTHLGFDEISRLDTPDPYTVVFRLNHPYSGFSVNFFSSGGGNPCVLPKHLLDKLETINDAPYNALPVGIGPFKYASWKRAESVEIVPDPLYFGRKPKLQRVIFKIVPDRNTVMTQLTTHEIDMWALLPAAYYDRARAIPGVTTVRQSSYAFNHVDFQLEHGPFRDPVVRRALRLATDRTTILEKVRHGVGHLQETPFGPGHPFEIKIPRVPFDIAAANRMLDGAGWVRGADGIRAKNGDRLEFTVSIPTGVPDTDTMVELIRGWWAQAGAKFEVKHYPSPLLFASAQAGGVLFGGKFDVALFGWTTNPNGDLTNIFGCDRFPPKGQNVPRYCNRRVDEQLHRFLTSYDTNVQRDAARIVQETIASDVPLIVLDAREDLFAYNDDLRDFHPNQVTAFDDLVEADI